MADSRNSIATAFDHVVADPSEDPYVRLGLVVRLAVEHLGDRLVVRREVPSPMTSVGSTRFVGSNVVGEVVLRRLDRSTLEQPLELRPDQFPNAEECRR